MHHYIFCTLSANEKNQIVDIVLLMIRNKHTFVIFVFVMFFFFVYQTTNINTRDIFANKAISEIS